MHRVLLTGFLGLSGACTTALAQAPGMLPQQAGPAPSIAPAQSLLMGQAIAALRANQPEQALTLFKQVLAADPQNAAANLLAASAEIALYQPTDAARYAERAQTLEPGNWKVHTTLVTAYAMSGDTVHRDAERVILRQAHSNPALADARGTNGFLLDSFKAGKYRVEAVEYFRPLGRYNTYYRFIMRDVSGAQVWTIEVNSDSLNQSSWAQSYPKQAKEGQRQFQIESAQDYPHVEYRTFSGAPSYDYIKPQIVKIAEAQTRPFPTETSTK